MYDMHRPNKSLCISSLRFDPFIQNKIIHVTSCFAEPMAHDVELGARSEPRVNENEESLTMKESLMKKFLNKASLPS